MPKNLIYTGNKLNVMTLKGVMYFGIVKSLVAHFISECGIYSTRNALSYAAGFIIQTSATRMVARLATKFLAQHAENYTCSWLRKRANACNLYFYHGERLCGLLKWEPSFRKAPFIVCRQSPALQSAPTRITTNRFRAMERTEYKFRDVLS